MLQVGNVTAKMEGFGCSDDYKLSTRLDVGDFTNFNGTEKHIDYEHKIK